jgi:hypothetical protein
MKARPEYRSQNKKFWANVRTIGQEIGYSRQKQVRVYTLKDLTLAMTKAGLDSHHLVDQNGTASQLANTLLGYFDYRADVLNNYVEPRLMDADRAEEVFDQLREDLQPSLPIPMNKQRGDKKKFAFLTGLVNMIVEANAAGLPCDYDPRVLTTIVRDNEPLRTLARRVDGCFPSCVNPIALWEIKEYYYTTTFGSRIADGIYETLLDGLELEELREYEGVHVEHLMIVDAYKTWWEMGKSYLCRMIDMLNMGYVDEILFGYEVIERLPQIVQTWVQLYHNYNQQNAEL